jgi:hypothetical protein
VFGLVGIEVEGRVLIAITDKDGKRGNPNWRDRRTDSDGNRAVARTIL